MELWPFATHPDRYRHWRLGVDGDTARLTLAVREDEPFRGNHVLKLNSYDLGVDIELADAVQRLRFEHPEVKVAIISGDTDKRDRIFCAGANIHMLAASSHPFKVNFCRFTNETRLAMEDASRHSGLRWLAAVNGACAGGGYELALACDDIVLVDDGSSTVSLPEVPLLAVLPGTGGLTRLVDKRRVRRDLADVFCTVAEGVKGKRAVDWRLVDALASRSRFGDVVAERARKLAVAAGDGKRGPGVKLEDVTPTVDGDTLRYRHVTLAIDRARRVAELTVQAPSDSPETWHLRAFRELDDAILRLRFQLEEIGLVLIRTRGDAAKVLAADAALAGDSWLARETTLLVARVLRRLETTARSFFAVIDEGSCFVGSLLELALACDRAYMLDAPGVAVQVGPLSGGALLTAQGRSRLDQRNLAAAEVLADARPLDAGDAAAAGLVTVTADDIDFADEVRVAVEERLSLSPDALTGMEASLRCPGPETMETKVFGRLSAFQNWIFTRPNATGERGALTMYGKPERPQFDPRRT
jgi:benzoyl-CoA-dihydrodiol lyase